MNILKLAWRNVWRNSRRSAVTIVAMVIALVIELLYSGLVTGLVSGMEEDAIEIETGDLQIFAPEYKVKPSLYEVIDDPEAIVEKVEAEGFKATERLFSGGLAASGESSAGVAFIGIDPVKDAEVLALHNYVGTGEWLSDSDPTGIVVGRRLARTLGLELGSEVVVLSQDAEGGIANELFTVRGILMTVGGGLDRSTILMPENTFRELMAMPEGAHKLILRRPARSELVAAGDTVRSLVGLPPAAEQAKVELEARIHEHEHPDEPPLEVPTYDIAVNTWKELNPFLAQYIDGVQGIIVIMYLIVYLAVAILILNAMLMAVFERIREIGVLKAIGYGPFQVASMMLLEGLIQGVVAVVIGAIIAAPGMWYLSTYGVNVGAIGGMEMAGLVMPAIWKSVYSVETSSTPIILLFVIVFFAVLYPALKAAWIRPIEAMHHQ